MKKNYVITPADNGFKNTEPATKNITVYVNRVIPCGVTYLFYSSRYRNTNENFHRYSRVINSGLAHSEWNLLVLHKS